MGSQLFEFDVQDLVLKPVKNGSVEAGQPILEILVTESIRHEIATSIGEITYRVEEDGILGIYTANHADPIRLYKEWIVVQQSVAVKRQTSPPRNLHAR